MSPLLLIGVILFSVAMVFYTWGVFSERKAQRLLPKHVILFACGVTVDTVATILTYIVIGGLVFTPHAIMGFISLSLMTIHFVWAISVAKKGDEPTLTNFHKLSLLVWGVWMISYLSGFVLGMGKVL